MAVETVLELVLLALVTAAAVVDLARRRIPNILLLVGWGVAVPLHLLSSHPNLAMLNALGGAVIGFTLFLPLYFACGGISWRNRFEQAADRYAATGEGGWPW